MTVSTVKKSQLFHVPLLPYIANTSKYPLVICDFHSLCNHLVAGFELDVIRLIITFPVDFDVIRTSVEPFSKYEF